MQTTRTPYSISFMATVLLLLLFACHSTIANAAVALGATRVIYPANQKQVLLPVTNNDPASVYLIQSWIENAGDQKDTQFVITPPLFSIVPYSSVPVLQRAGYTRYALAMGEYRSGNNLQSSPKFIQGSLMHGLEGNWTPYGGMQIAEDYQAFNLGIGKDLGLFGAFSFDITQANTTLADGTRHSGQSIKSVYSKSFYQTGTNIQVAGYRYSTQGFYNLSDSAYSRMSGYTVKPPTGDSNEQTQFIDYFNLCSP